MSASNSHSSDIPFSDSMIAKCYVGYVASSVCAIVVGLLVLLGWKIQSAILLSAIPGYIEMKGNTAIAFILLGSAMWLLRPQQKILWQRFAGGILAVATMIIGLLSCSEYLFDLDFHIDTIFFQDTTRAGGKYRPGLMPPVTAACFSLISLGLLLLHSKSRYLFQFMQVLIITVNAVGMLVLFAYLFNLDSFIGFVPTYPAIALHTAFLFVILTFGILLARPKEGVISILTNDTFGGTVARRLLPLSFLIPLTIGLLRIQIEHFGLYTGEYAASVAAFLNMLVFSTLILWNSRSLTRMDLENILLHKKQVALVEDLRGTNKELEDFAYVISHDLKAPLRGVNSIAEWIATDYADKLDEQGKKYLAMLKTRMEKMNDLINGVLEYSRAGKRQEQRLRIDLNKLAADVIELLSIKRNVNVTIETPLPMIEYEPNQIKEVFQNLLSNAVKFMDKEAGQISIACQESDGYWVLSVADNGPGIDEKYFEKIFQMFQTLAPKDKTDSTGIGLTIVKKIIEKNKGKVWVQSQPGNGSTFYFTIPKENR